MVRVLTSNRTASSEARTSRGARALSSSTSAYNRSVRFTSTRLDRHGRSEGAVAQRARFRCGDARRGLQVACHLRGYYRAMRRVVVTILVAFVLAACSAAAPATPAATLTPQPRQ